MAELHEMISFLRKQKGMSQQELAKRIGVSRSTIGMYETGKREPEIDMLNKMAEIFGVSMNTMTGVGFPDVFGVFDKSSTPEKLLRFEKALNQQNKKPAVDNELSDELSNLLSMLTDEQKSREIAYLKSILTVQDK